MSPDRILHVLYDLMLTIGGETRSKQLMTRFLQRLLYHTSYPAGIFFLDLTPVDPENDQAEATIGAVVGDFELLGSEGKVIRLPATLLHGEVKREDSAAALLSSLDGNSYDAYLRLPVQGVGTILLLAPVMPETDLPLLHMFQPVLAHLGHALHLYREGERRTERMIASSRNLEKQRNLMASVYDSLHVAVMITDEQGSVIATNPAFTRITGYSYEEMAGHNPRILSSGRHDREFYSNMWHSIMEQGYWQGEIWNRRKSGEVYPEWLSVTRAMDQASGMVHFVAVFSDITDQKAAQHKIEYMAHYDQLTGLPNRVLLQDRFERATTQADRDGTLVALLFVDLDNFKYINDVYGHALGDRMLKVVAQRLRDWLRVTDVLSRHGGDEFVMVLTAMRDEAAVSQAAEKVVQLLHDPFEVDGNIFYIRASIGISIYPRSGDSFEALLSQADMAMYQAKASGRDAFHFFNESMDRTSRERLDLDRRLRDAMAAGEFVLFFQPQVSFPGRQIVGAECLLRWQSADGMVSPAQFIPAAEESGLIVPLGEWVLRQACQYAQRWREKGMQAMSVAVNLSAVQLRRGDIAETVRSALAESGLPPALLELELTESMLIQDTESTVKLVHELKRLGVKLSLDDFGTGYSNMSYLQRLHVDKLKVDQSFVRNMTTSTEAMAIVRAMVEMGHGLNLVITAEGVETEEQAQMLQDMGCNFGQGYLFCKPAPEQELAAMLEKEVASTLAGTRTMLH